MLSENLERIDPKSGIDALRGLIEKAKLLLAEKPINLPEYATWNEAARDCLIRIYGPASPNVFTIVGCSCDDAAWSDMAFGTHNPTGRDKITENYAASCLAARSRLLESCIVALKAKLKASTEITKQHALPLSNE